MPGFNEISPEKLMRLVGTPDCPVLVDVRVSEDIDADPSFVPTSFAHSHTQLPALVDKLAGRKSVIVCQKGKKLSFGVSAWLQSQGLETEVLAGGKLAWNAAKLPVVPREPAAQPGSLWVTRHRPKIDRIACPWLIRRFVDPEAKFLFVPSAEVADVADRFNAIPFDTDIQPWTHVGAFCTFDTMVKRFGLAHEALDRLALVVRAADTDSHDLAPQAAGLLAISTGLSRQYKDDTQQLEAGLHIYDALYRWARDAFSEGHDWPVSNGEK